MRSIAIAATTLDGKIALERDHFSDWTSPEDKAFMRKLLDEADVIVVGNNTYKTAEKPLSSRNCIVLTSSIAAVERKRDNLLDELYLTIEPIVFGHGVSLFDHSQHVPACFSLLSMQKLNANGTVLLHYSL